MWDDKQNKPVGSKRYKDNDTALRKMVDGVVDLRGGTDGPNPMRQLSGGGNVTGSGARPIEVGVGGVELVQPVGLAAASRAANYFRPVQRVLTSALAVAGPWLAPAVGTAPGPPPKFVSTPGGWVA